MKGLIKIPIYSTNPIQYKWVNPKHIVLVESCLDGTSRVYLSVINSAFYTQLGPEDINNLITHGPSNPLSASAYGE